jgi:signal transduction histidine kinase
VIHILDRVAKRALRRAPRTIRLRLTTLYGSLFLASGAGLLTVTYFLVRHQYTDKFFISTARVKGASFSIGVAGGAGSGTIVSSGPGVGPTAPLGLPTPQQAQALAERVQSQAHQQSVAALHQLLINSGVALAIMAVISIWLGWVVAGRALRPLRTIANAARDISASDLHQRLALDGPDDELKQLGNTFDGLLERLEASFSAQRQFVANASHELRTPLTLERTLVEVALADSDATEDTLRETLRRVLAAGEQQERLIEALLTLSRSQRGLDQHEPFDLAAVTDEILLTRRTEAEQHRLRIETTLDPALASGDARLGERLIANLVDNAIRHNVDGGRIEIATETKAGHAVLSVTNSGPMVPTAEVGRLFEPFQRLATDRNGDDNGLGLGLSIVHAIAGAHGAVLTVQAQPAGGLDIEVSFPVSGP